VLNPDLRFLENLKQNLSTGNRKSIYLNAVAGRYLGRLDAADLEKIDTGLTTSFLDNLLEKRNASLNIRIAPEQLKNQDIAKIAQKLNSIAVENQDHFEEHGVETLGFGFPVLVRRDSQDPKKIIKAPMFIWSLKMKRNWKKINEWILEWNEDCTVFANFAMAAHIMNDAQIQLDPLYDYFVEDRLFDKEELTDMILKQYSRLIFEEKKDYRAHIRAHLDYGLRAFPENEEIEKLVLREPQIFWSGIFGLFKTQKESILNDLNNYIGQFSFFENQNQQAQNRFSGFHSFSALDTDPSQLRILNKLNKGENLIIQGPPGTGKSQTLTAMISNVISNGGKCLIVCEKKTAMEVLHNNLKKLGLGELSVIIEDIYRDRNAVVNSVRDRAQNIQQLSNDSFEVKSRLLKLLNNTTENIRKLQQFNNSSNETICSEEKRGAIIEKYLTFYKNYSKKELNQQLRLAFCSFEKEEYEILIQIIRTIEPLYLKVNTLEHPFNDFDRRLFTDSNPFGSFDFIKNELSRILISAGKLKKELIEFLQNYREEVSKDLTDIHLKKSNLVLPAISLTENGLKTQKYFFKKNKGIIRSFLATVFQSCKKLNADKKVVIRSYETLTGLHQKYEFYPFDFLKYSEHKEYQFEDLLKNLFEYRTELNVWNAAHNQLLEAILEELSTEKYYKPIDRISQIKSLTNQSEVLLNEIKNTNLLSENFSFEDNTLKKRLKKIESIENYFDALLKKMDEEFNNFYRFRFQLQQLNENQKNIIQALAKSNLTEWENHFSSWYFYNLIQIKQNENVPGFDNYDITLAQYEKNIQDLKLGLASYTLEFWRSEQLNALKNFNQEKSSVKVNSLYNLRGSNGSQRKPLRQIFEADPNLFSSFFPVLMVSPAVCASMLPLRTNLFDVVIFDEASQLRLEDTFCALSRGTVKIVSGDSKQMPPSDYFQTIKTLLHNDDEQDEELEASDLELMNLQKESVDFLSTSESLLEYCVSEGSFKEDLLEVHYRSQNSQLINFSNAAFYGNKLKPFPKNDHYRAINFYNLDGMYDKRVNDAEAEAVVQKMVEIVQEAEKNTVPIPSVGVATFNMEQRNYILDKIRKKVIEKPELGALFEALFASGLFIKNLENIQGDERDIMLISTTFGRKKDGRFIQNFGPINRELGYRLLNVIITRAKKSIYIFNSIPSNVYGSFQELIKENGNKGKGIFYAYLAYAKAVSDGDLQSQDLILKQVSDNKEIQMEFSKRKKQTNYQLLAKYLIEKNNNLNNPSLAFSYGTEVFGIEVPVLVSDMNGKALLAIFIDSNTEKVNEESYAWELFNKQLVKSHGIDFLQIWTRDCIENESDVLVRIGEKLNSL
jgi:superfamily I DNA and/or RNA helicase